MARRAAGYELRRCTMRDIWAESLADVARSLVRLAACLPFTLGVLLMRAGARLERSAGRPRWVCQ